ncbi:hypothetical protein ACFVWN_23025 [Nocardiopsis flavescens]|uniref:hypothetical protein n=1 Tax=Nocardiopsis flavescens TaxID=758803 RepID=UPI00365F4B48
MGTGGRPERAEFAKDGTGAASPRTPVDVLDDLIERRRHPSSSEECLGWERHNTDDEQRYGRIRGFQRQGGSLAPTGRHRGRASSWAVVALATLGAAAVGLGVAQGMAVWLLVAGGVLLAAALVLALVTDIFGDVVLDSPSLESEERHDTPLHRIRSGQRRSRRERRRGGRGATAV